MPYLQVITKYSLCLHFLSISSQVPFPFLGFCLFPLWVHLPPPISVFSLSWQFHNPASRSFFLRTHPPPHFHTICTVSHVSPVSCIPCLVSFVRSILPDPPPPPTYSLSLTASLWHEPGMESSPQTFSRPSSSSSSVSPSCSKYTTESRYFFVHPDYVREDPIRKTFENVSEAEYTRQGWYAVRFPD